MTFLSDLYRTLDPDERIIAGDQFKMAGLADSCWAPVEAFVGHRVREFVDRAGRIEFRRLVVSSVVQ